MKKSCDNINAWFIDDRPKLKGGKTVEEKRLGAVEARFADIVWSNQPISSGKLVELCKEQLHWKKSTTYTVLKKLSLRGIFCNEGGIVKAVVTRDEFYSMQSRQFVNEMFNGSLPSFIAAFTAGGKANKEELEKIKLMIDSAFEKE